MFSIEQSSAKWQNIYIFAYIQSVGRSRMRQSPRSASLPAFPSASGHLGDSVTMSMVQGGFDTANDLSSLSPGGTLYNESKPSKTYPFIMLYRINTQFLEVSKNYLQRLWISIYGKKSSWRANHGSQQNAGECGKEHECPWRGFMDFTCIFQAYIWYIIATCSLISLSPLYLVSQSKRVSGFLSSVNSPVQWEKRWEYEAVWTTSTFSRGDKTGKLQEWRSALSLLLVVPAGITVETDRSPVPRTCRALASHNSTRDRNSSDGKKLHYLYWPIPKEHMQST